MLIEQSRGRAVQVVGTGINYRGQRRGMSAEPGSEGQGVGRVRVMSRGEVAQPLHLRGSRRRQVWTDAGGHASAGAEGGVEVSGVKAATAVSDQDWA